MIPVCECGLESTLKVCVQHILTSRKKFDSMMIVPRPSGSDISIDCISRDYDNKVEINVWKHFCNEHALIHLVKYPEQRRYLRKAGVE